MKKILTSAALALSIAGSAMAAGGEKHVTDYSFSFEGPFGKYDQAQLQRGLQVYTEVCASCHGLRQVPFRAMEGDHALGYTDEEVRAYASTFYEVFDPELDDFRPAEPQDKFPAVTTAGAPDLSLMAKARAGWNGPYGLGLNQLFRGMGGAEYIASILTHYSGESKEEYGARLYENDAFEGGYISMAPPLVNGQVEFADGAPNDIESMSKDVAAFLMWAAEPKMMQRKQAGFTAVLFLTFLSVLLYFTNKSIWAPVKKKRQG